MRGIVAVLLALTAWGCGPSAAEPAARGGATRTSEDAARIRFGPGDRHVLELPGGERRPVASLLKVSSPLRYGQFVWNEAGIPEGRAWIRVDLAAQTLSVFRAGNEIGTAVILYGADSHPTPRGRFPILAKLKDHRSSIYDAAMPYTLRLTGDGVAIHGSNVRNGAATHGCIGIPTAFAEHVFAAVRRGDPVYIVPETDASRRRVPATKASQSQQIG